MRYGFVGDPPELVLNSWLEADVWEYFHADVYSRNRLDNVVAIAAVILVAFRYGYSNGTKDEENSTSNGDDNDIMSESDNQRRNHQMQEESAGKISM